jgi:hypothetical protein
LATLSRAALFTSSALRSRSARRCCSGDLASPFVEAVGACSRMSRLDFPPLPLVGEPLLGEPDSGDGDDGGRVGEPRLVPGCGVDLPPLPALAMGHGGDARGYGG